MSNANETADRLILEFAEAYMEKVFYFCLKKTGRHADAEDLTQDIALHVITALHRGTIPEHFPAWVWQIARNRYAMWAHEKHRRNESVTGSDIGDYEIEDEDANIPDEVMRGEALAALRRELAFISSDYRNIVVAYYLENRSMRDIAATLSLSLEAVKKRLQRARIILKEGMDMAREFGKRSYNPEEIAFVQDGREGRNGQPWSIVTRLLYKNIFLETYKNPETAEELALELGVALPYMEDILEYLVEEELLKKSGDRYETNFRIVSREEQREKHQACVKIQKALADKLCEMIDLYMEKSGAGVNVSNVGYENAKWALLCRTFDHMKSCNQATSYRNTHPDRPDGGMWTLTGYETIDWKKPHFVGLNTARSYDINQLADEKTFGQYKFFMKRINEKTPEHLSVSDVEALGRVYVGEAEQVEAGCLEKLLEYGYLKRENDVLQLNVVVFDKKEEAPCDAALAERLGALKQEISELMMQAPTISRGYVVYQAWADGWIKYDEETINSIGAYLYL